jgi:SAM-dependent methyltransferase
VVETALVRSNVRAHRGESFGVWRCGGCRSIHATDDVDLAHYYRDYPFLRAQPSWVGSYLHRRLWARLARAGAAGCVLDYGCGAGLLVDDLRARGLDAHGYDAYAPRFADTAALDSTYDVVLSQDVIEHVDDPLALLDTFDGLVRGGGLIAIGTPDAAALELAAPEAVVHSLHQPYHRHILSRDALVAAGQARGWSLVRWYGTSHVNTPLPTLNLRYLLRYLRSVDDTVDVAHEPARLRLAMLSPAALFDAVFGGLRCPPTDGMAIFRKP